MNLVFTSEQEAFRAAARAWLAANVPTTPLASMDTAEGFAQHRAWERTLHDGGYAMVSWPVEGLESDEDPKLRRSSMFVSEVAARPLGLWIRYREKAQAERAATVLRVQFGQIGIKEEV